MKVLIDPSDVERFSVLDHQGNLHALSAHLPRPFPFCASCGRQVEGIAAATFADRGAFLYVARCHGDDDVVRFRQDDAQLVALPCFQDSAEQRASLFRWLSTGAPAGTEFH